MYQNPKFSLQTDWDQELLTGAQNVPLSDMFVPHPHKAKKGQVFFTEQINMHFHRHAR